MLNLTKNVSIDLPNILILCTANSCRSQMAEGIARHFLHEYFLIFSAGSKPSLVHPLAIQVMKEISIDISMHTSKSLDKFKHLSFQNIITVCSHANETCPVFLGDYKRIHWPFDDPAIFNPKNTVDHLSKFRYVRDEIYIKFKKEWRSLVL